MSTSWHPRAAWPSETKSRSAENYLRGYIWYHQNNCNERFPTAELSNKTAVCEDLDMSRLELEIDWVSASLLNFMSCTNVPVQNDDDFRVTKMLVGGREEFRQGLWRSKGCGSIDNIQETRLRHTVHVLGESITFDRSILKVTDIR